MRCVKVNMICFIWFFVEFVMNYLFIVVVIWYFRVLGLEREVFFVCWKKKIVVVWCVRSIFLDEDVIMNCM